MSATDILCKWNVPKIKDASMSRVADINWKSSNFERPKTSLQNCNDSFITYIDSLQRLDDEIIINFINDVHSDGYEPALRTILFPEEKRRYSEIKDEVFLANLYNENYLHDSHDELVRIGKLNKLEISKKDIEEISRVTLSQRKSKFWVALKRGRITGSTLKDCCVTSIDNPSVTTISRVINPMKNFCQIPTIKYEIKNKKKAIKQYRMEVFSSHENFQYQACGLLFNQKLPFFTDSSDGLVCCDCHGVGCLKVKCLKVLETQSFDYLTKKPNNILNKFGEQFHMEYTHEFFYRAQMNIRLSDTKYCDFVLWSSIQILVLRINEDEEFWKMVSVKALTFHEEVIMPELLGKFFTKGKGCVIYILSTSLITTYFLESSTPIEYIDETDKDSNDDELIELEVEILCPEEKKKDELIELEVQILCPDEEHKGI